jgi:ferredoxin
MTSPDDMLQTAFGVPAFAVPWADQFFEPLELRLVAALAAGPRPPAELLRELPELGRDGLARAYRRGIIDWQTEDGEQGADQAAGDAAGARVGLADFHARFDVWAMFEGWRTIPPSVAAKLNEWELAHYVDAVAPDVQAIRSGAHAEGDPGAADLAYLLLGEAEAIVQQVPHVYLWPCDCRSMFGRCGKPVTVCLLFENNRGLGWEISAERAVQVLRASDKAGLMHTGYAGRPVDEIGAICNCCTDCCFPHLAAQRLGAADVWPRRRHRAVVRTARCTLCWRCTRRCPFGALTRQRVTTAAGGGRAKVEGAEGAGGAAAPSPCSPPAHEQLVFLPELCRGCGLCATGCPEDAIVMETHGVGG